MFHKCKWENLKIIKKRPKMLFVDIPLKYGMWVDIVFKYEIWIDSIYLLIGIIFIIFCISNLRNVCCSIFLDIEVGDDGSCNRDALTIGPDPVMELCGNNRQLVYISKSSHVWLKFYADGLISGKGFKIQYIRGKKQSPCIWLYKSMKKN